MILRLFHKSFSLENILARSVTWVLDITLLQAVAIVRALLAFIFQVPLYWGAMQTRGQNSDGLSNQVRDRELLMLIHNKKFDY